MKWALTQLQKYNGRDFKFNEEFDASSLIDGLNVLDITDATVSGYAIVEKAKVTFSFEVNATFTLPCSRTLQPVLYPVKVKTAEIFYQDEIPEGSDGYLMEKGTIDLVPVVEEILFLEIPMQVYADSADQKQSGLGWDLVTEEEEKNETKIDPRMAELTKLLKKQE